MEQQDIIQIRDQLKKWKKTPPRVSQTLLSQFLESLVSKEDLDKSKIFKVVQDIAYTKISNLKEQDLSPYNGQHEQFNKVIELAKEVLDFFQHAIKYSKLQKTKLKIPEPVIDFRIEVNDLRQDLFEDYQDFPGQYVNIKPYLSVLSKSIIQNLESSKIDCFQQETIDVIKSVAFTMVKEIYLKYESSNLGLQSFKSDMKTLITYIKRDKGSFVLKALLNGEFTAKTAAQLRSSDWASQEMKDEEKRLQQNSFETDNTDYSKNLYQSFQKITNKD